MHRAVIFMARLSNKSAEKTISLGGIHCLCLSHILSVCSAPFLILQYLYALEVPLEIHGRAFLGKYLNSDTTRYNMDASIELYCTLLRYKKLSLFVRYRDDLDMAKQEGGVSLDPRSAHYYIAGGIDYTIMPLFFSGSFTHDCIHDIDIEVEGTPVFNRLGFQFADAHYHRSRRLKTSKRFLWSIELGFYPHWYYHGWVINFGADYNYEMMFQAAFNVLRTGWFGVNIDPCFCVIRGDTSFYHKHVLRITTFYRNNSRQIGLGLDYHIWNTDPLKHVDRLWLLSLFIEF